MTYFDANAFIGRWPSEALAYNDVEGLLSSMRFLKIDRALVSSTIAWQNSPILGNKLLMDAISNHDELEPCWVVTPGLQVADQGGTKAICKQMAQNEVRAVRLYPRDHMYSLKERGAIELLTELNKRRYLVIIDLDQILIQRSLYDYDAGSMDVLDWLCSNYSDLSILITHVGYRVFQILFPLLQTYPNLYLDLSFFASHQGVETVVEKLGTDHLIFGTGQPLMDPGGALLRLTSAGISKEDLQKIAGENLDRLLNRVNLKSASRDQQKPLTQIKEILQKNNWDDIPQRIEITDAHVHMGPYYKFYIPQNSPQEMLRVMDHLHIARSCISSHLAITGDWYTGNRLTAQAVSDHPDRFTGYVVVSPNEPELANDELSLAFNEWGFKGIKLVPDTHLQPIGSEGYRPVFEFASQRRCLVLVHTYHGSSFDDPQLFGTVAEKYPEVPIVMVHSGALPSAFNGAIRLAKEHPNLFLDISGSFITATWIRRMVSEVGADRVIFSSDQPFMDPRYSLGRLLYANLPEEALALVLGGNIRRLLTNPILFQ
jgi:predicted TIM-barrel fold metal-dependent hydrolase